MLTFKLKFAINNQLNELLFCLFFVKQMDIRHSIDQLMVANEKLIQQFFVNSGERCKVINRQSLNDFDCATSFFVFFYDE